MNFIREIFRIHFKWDDNEFSFHVGSFWIAAAILVVWYQL